MYHRTTIMDAFNAAGRFTQQTLVNMDEYKREDADAFLRNIPAEFQTDIQNRIRDNPFNYTGDPDDKYGLESYTRDYMADLEDYADEWYQKKTGEKAAPYVRRHIEQMRTQANQSLRNLALVKQDEWRVQRAQIKLEENNGKFIEAMKNNDLTPQQAVEAIYNNIDLSGKEFEINPQVKNNLRKKYEITAYQENFANVLGRVHDVHNLEGAIKKAKADFDFMPSMTLNTYDKDGNVIGTDERPWGFDKKDEWEKEELRKATERIYGEHYGFFQEKQAQMDRMVVSGDINRAINFAKEWGAEWNKYYDPKNNGVDTSNHEFLNSNKDYRDKGSGFFDWKMLVARLRHGNGDIINLLECYGPEMFIRPQLTGDGNVIVGHKENGEPIIKQYKSIKEAMEGWIHYESEAFFEANGKNALTQQLLEEKRAEWFEKYYDEVGKALRQIDPALASEFELFRKRDTYINNKSEFYNSKISDEERERYAQRCINFFNSVFFNGITDGPTIRQMMREFTGKEILTLLPKQNMPNEKGDRFKLLKKFSDEAMSGKAEDIIFKIYNPERLGVSGVGKKPTYDFITTAHQNAVEDIVERERLGIAIDLGLSVEALKPDWMPSPRRNDDVIPKGIFVIDKGEHQGTYYRDYDDNANPITMKQTDKGWVEYKKTERPLTESEKIDRRVNTIGEYEKIILKGKEPHTGKEFTKLNEPPPGSAFTQAQWNNPLFHVPKAQLWAQWYMENEGAR